MTSGEAFPPGEALAPRSVPTAEPAAETPPPPFSYLATLLGSLPAAVIVTGTDGVICYAAGQLDRLGGRSYGDLLGTKVTDHVPGPGGQKLLEQLILTAAGGPDGGTAGPLQLAYCDAGGNELLSEVWAVNRGGEGGIGGIVLLFSPESAYGRLDEVLTSVVVGGLPIEQAYGAIALALRRPPVEAEAYFLVPGDDRRTVRIPELGRVPGPPLEGPWDEIWAGAAVTENETLAGLPEAVREAAKETGCSAVSCFAVRPGSDGRPEACLVVWRRQESRLMPIARLAVERAVVVASLVRAHRLAEEGFGDVALRDPLTGLGNERSLARSLAGHVEAGEQPAVLLLDLDGFRQVNEGLGRLAGDAVLRVTARRLGSVMRPTDELGRLAGDEFAVVCNGRPSSEQMVMIAERLVEQLSRPLSVGQGVSADVGVCIGIALDFPVGTTVEELLGHAQHALDGAKGKGRGHWAIATADS